MPNNKLYGLEIIRFLSALAILIFHFQHFSFVGQAPNNFSLIQLPFYDWLKPVYLNGGLGVQIFWGISGFIFFWKYAKVIAQKTLDAKHFFVLRFSRLYPLHLLTLLLVAGLQIFYLQSHESSFVYGNTDWRHFVPQLFLASNWGGQGFSFNGPIWSISVEVLIYLFFFLVARYLGASLFISIAVLLICAFIKYYNLTESFIVDCLLYFYVGGMTAALYKRLERSAYRKISLLIAFIATIVAPFIFNLSNTNFSKILLFCYVPFLIYAGTINIAASKKCHGVIAAFGNMTYSSYLLHFPLQLLLVLIFELFSITIPIYDSLFFGVFLLSILLLSYLTYRFFERPMQNIIRR
ncbi:acyltransferase [Polynucleobacter sp. AP-Reno-20A-A9]|uniref:acyltransferase family protein n=1 Tax=Polynucleobacter sp. AP-Reno-20A-A9 TaxID=2576925 RepID=UPI001C0D5174|nr:acyltransferase [Polynucleobacter sp. AP-Reno-20A-A9]MBU3627457.1 acyltransferase [Polynucleobacter sp. AP-Reno-20A-A9]